MRWLEKNREVPAMVESMHQPKYQGLNLDRHFRRCELANRLFTAELLWLCADWWTATTSPTVMARDELRKMAEWCMGSGCNALNWGEREGASAYRASASRAERRAKELEDENG
jgi:ribosomal protein L39E